MSNGKQELRFCLQGNPVAWHRPKFTRSNRIDGRGTRAYKDKRDVEYQTALAMEATSAIMRWRHENDAQWRADGEWHLDVEFHVKDLVKRDVDNLLKGVLDGLNTIVYLDDKQVVSVYTTKHLNRKAPRTVVTIRRVEGYMSEQAEAGLGLGEP